MKLKAIESIFRILGTPKVTIHNDWVLGKCAFAKFKHSGGVDNNPSFSIQLNDKGVSRYHCFSCGSSGDVMGMAMELSDLCRTNSYRGFDLKTLMLLCAEELDEVELTDATIPEYTHQTITPKVDYDFPDWWYSGFSKAMSSEVARAYLSTREITPEVVEELNLGWDAKQRRVVFPFYNSEGLLCGVNGRAVSPNTKLRYYQYQFEGKTNLHLWYGENWMDLDRPLIVTESVFDLASIKRVYSNVVAAFTCSFSKEKALRLGDAVEIITIFDAGEGGDRARDTIKKHLGSLVTKQITPESDAGDATDEWLLEVLRPHVKCLT